MTWLEDGLWPPGDYSVRTDAEGRTWIGEPPPIVYHPRRKPRRQVATRAVEVLVVLAIFAAYGLIVGWVG